MEGNGDVGGVAFNNFVERVVGHFAECRVEHIRVAKVEAWAHANVLHGGNMLGGINVVGIFFGHSVRQTLQSCVSKAIVDSPYYLRNDNRTQTVCHAMFLSPYQEPFILSMVIEDDRCSLMRARK